MKLGELKLALAQLPDEAEVRLGIGTGEAEYAFRSGRIVVTFFAHEEYGTVCDLIAIREGG